MSLITDAIFVQALRSNSALMQQLADGDVYNTTIALPDEELDNAELPYIIVSFDGFTNEGSTKDNAFEGDTDRVTVSIEVAAETRPQLGQIMQDVRSTILDFFDENFGEEGYELIPDDYQLRGSAVNYDSLKPCYYQVLTYDCDTNQ